jgi:hypothetical protein
MFLVSFISILLINALHFTVTFFDKITEAQRSGFRAEYSTIDHVFILNALKSKMYAKREALAFVDFKKLSIVLIAINYIYH